MNATAIPTEHVESHSPTCFRDARCDPLGEGLTVCATAVRNEFSCEDSQLYNRRITSATPSTHDEDTGWGLGTAVTTSDDADDTQHTDAYNIFFLSFAGGSSFACNAETTILTKEDFQHSILPNAPSDPVFVLCSRRYEVSEGFRSTTGLPLFFQSTKPIHDPRYNHFLSGTRQPYHRRRRSYNDTTTCTRRNRLRERPDHGPVHGRLPRHRTDHHNRRDYRYQYARPTTRYVLHTTKGRRVPNINHANMRTKGRSRYRGTLRTGTQRRHRRPTGTRSKVPRTMTRNHLLLPCPFRNAIRRTFRVRRQRNEDRHFRVGPNVHALMRGLYRQPSPRPRRRPYRHKGVTNRPRRPIRGYIRPFNLTRGINLHSLQRRRRQGATRRTG